jgi:hypothetical protein
MYKKTDKINSSKNDLSNYIEGFDVYNSVILEYLNDTSLAREDYMINTYEYRPDMIAKDYYGSTSYMGILFLTCGTSFDNYSKGTVLRLIKKEDLDKVMDKI